MYLGVGQRRLRVRVGVLLFGNLPQLRRKRKAFFEEDKPNEEKKDGGQA